MHRWFTLLAFSLALPVLAADRPNVILIMTDDQGYGDIAAHGNPVLKTPNLDKLHSESVRLTDYHTDPTCSPTRAALLTGRYSTRTGVWHTINGRSLMHPDEYTMAEYFRDNGYRTGMFGKWHLGSNAPLRPMDQGFEHCVWSPGGAVNQGANWLGNDCFDDTYKLKDKWQKFPGYHTDVWFSEAMKFIEKDDDKPFFIYMPTTAVHDPWNIEDEKSKYYLDKGVPKTMAKFYAMITNIDDNVGKLRAFLDKKGLAENTIFIFTTDNGTTAGWIDRKSGFKYFDAGMRAWKGSEYDGGHRVPFFMHWPRGGLAKGKDIDYLSAHIDVMPTLAMLCGLKPIDPSKLKRGPIDGKTYAIDGQWGVKRTLFVHVQRQHIPPKWKRTAVMTEQWRLVNESELYDITKDPAQQNNVAADHPEVVTKLTADYEKWWASLAPSLKTIVRFDLGGAENPTTLMSHDWLMKEGASAWHHSYIKRNDLRNGPFAVNVVKAGRYRITPMRWPDYVDKPSGCSKVSVDFVYDKREAQSPAITVTNGRPLDPEQPCMPIEVYLSKGTALMTSTLTRPDGKTFGAYYVKVQYLGD